eukprot:g51870.t1
MLSPASENLRASSFQLPVPASSFHDFDSVEALLTESLFAGSFMCKSFWAMSEIDISIYDQSPSSTVCS